MDTTNAETHAPVITLSEAAMKEHHRASQFIQRWML